MTNELVIPQSFKNLLGESRGMRRLVGQTEEDFGGWLADNKLQFFTEYTDHGLGHVNDVLATAETLIRPACANMITHRDAATLVLASVLHDAAMHLTLDGFRALVAPGRTHAPIPGFDDLPWPRLWEDFFAEARRFSGRQLIQLFGDDRPVRRLPVDPMDLTERDKLLAGEFLRRHHPRLAHEIALQGVPGPDPDDRLRLVVDEDTLDIVDLAGLVARSHGMPMRDCLPYLDEHFSLRKKPSGVHAVYLMALLRLADILQIERDRAPWRRRKLEHLRSPVSRREWAMHQAIRNVDYKEFPETVFVRAEPGDVDTYLRIKDQLTWIQEELDESWSVVGEVYAFDESFRELGFTLRRVRSNLDDEEAFAGTVEYIPCRAAFEVGDSDLLKLLVGPLYGNKPEIGIRELLQNALDAVNERREYLLQNPDLEDEVEFSDHEGDVLIDISPDDDGQWWATVSDKGIGMTPETVRDYFLKAGASFRRSEAWRKTFEDEDGSSRILRSGRFGVGALAAFLLGDRIELETRHLTCPSVGVRFTAQVDDSVIELGRCERPVGTTIRVLEGVPIFPDRGGDVRHVAGKGRRGSRLCACDR